MITEKTVLVFDICSSTIMMEEVQTTSSLDSYSEFIHNIRGLLKSLQNHYKYEIYKFLGDGFILLFDNSITPEQIYNFAVELVDNCCKFISIFKSNHMQNAEMPREGITIGVDSGILYYENNEYIGRPINIACRLQGKLDLTESVNRIIISQKVYSKIIDLRIKNMFENKPKVLKNVNNNREIPCYESSPIQILGTKGKHTKNMDISNQEYFPIDISKIEVITNNHNYKYQIKRANGEILYTSENYTNKQEIMKYVNNLARISKVNHIQVKFTDS